LAAFNGKVPVTAVAALAARGADSLLAEFATGSGSGPGSGAGEAAFAEVVRRHAAAVFATCLRVTKNAHDADDATQVTFLTLALQVKAGKPIAKLAPWLQRVAHRAALDVRRGRRRREAHEQRHAEARRREVDLHHRDLERGAGAGAGAALASRNGAADVDVERLGDLMAEELAKLPARYRLPLASLYCADLSRAQIAEELNLTPHALRLRIHRGRKMLAERLSARGVGPAGKLLKGSLLATAIVAVARQAMVARAAGAAGATGAGGAGGAAALGTDLVAETTARVLAAVNATLAATVVAKLKGVAGIVLLLGVSAVAAGSAAAANWPAIEGRLPPAVRQLIDAVTSPWRLPQFRPAGPGLPTPMARGNGETAPGPSSSSTGAAAPAASPADAVATDAHFTKSVPAQVNPVPAATVATARRPADPPSVSPSIHGSSGSGGAGRAASAIAGAAPERSRRAPASSDDVVPAAPRATRERETATRQPQSPEPAGHGGSGAFAFSGEPASGSPAFSGRSLSIAALPGEDGTYVLHSGIFSVDTLDVGRAGQGRFVQQGGTNQVSRLWLGAGAGGRGDYDLVAGSLVVGSPVGGGSGAIPYAPSWSGVHVGGEGRGALHLGGGDSPGGVVIQPRGPDSPRPVPPPGTGNRSMTLLPSMIVSGDAGGSGLIEGWGGAIGNGGAFVNNGRVIADGGGRAHELVLLGYGAVTSTVENNPAGGTNGWYARNMGRLFLPKIPVAPGTGTYTWGEDPADPTIDLVNSVRLTLHDAVNPGKLDVSLLDKHRAEVPTLPTGHTFIGVWSLDTGLTKPAGGVELVVRYDDGLAHDLGLNEGSLKLWQYESGEWRRINDSSFARDLTNHILSGHADPGLTFFAVSAPEPGALFVFGLAGAALLMRRRR
jgi:RNA polymerase sigma factor (sigma-70 family)